MAYDYSYGCFLTHFPPFNCISVPFVPFSILLRYRHPRLITINKMVNRAQCIFPMIILFIIYLIISTVLIPPAYVISCVKKIKTLKESKNFSQKLEDKLLFIPFGLLIMFINLYCDAFYFWVNIFRRDLKQIIIEKDATKISHNSLK